MEASTVLARNTDVVATILAALPEFSGTENQTSSGDMRNSMKYAAAKLGTTLEKVASCVPCKLRGKARDTYMECIANIR
jgi:hypothetical protein